MNGDGGCRWWQPTGGLAAQVSWLGLRVNGLHSSNESSELLHWPCHDDNTVNIDVSITTTTITSQLCHCLSAAGGDDIGAYAVCQRRSSSRQHDLTAKVLPRLPTFLYDPRLGVQRIHDKDSVAVIISCFAAFT